MVMLPVKVLVAVRTNVPAPDLVNPPEPEIIPEISSSPLSPVVKVDRLQFELHLILLMIE